MRQNRIKKFLTAGLSGLLILSLTGCGQAAKLPETVENTSLVVEKDGRLYLFYTAVDSSLAQTQCLAWTDDGQHFTKYPGNPILPQSPIDPASRDFRDPKVFPWKDGSYRMVCGVGKEGYAAVVLYRSQDLLHWDYVGPLFETREMGPVLECPDLFPLEDKWVLCFSRMDEPRCVQFVLGGFDGERFVPENLQRPALGPNFYAPQSFVDHQGRRILLGWMAPWERPMDQDEVRRGCLTVPLEPFFDDAGQLCLFPVEEAQPYLTQEDAHIRRGAWLFQVTDGEKLLVRIGVVQLATKNYAEARKAALEAQALNPEDGMTYFVLAQCYGAQASGANFTSQAMYWVAYDTMEKAAQLLEEADLKETATKMMAAFRSAWPSKEECFFNEVQAGQRYVVNGIATTVRCIR